MPESEPETHHYRVRILDPRGEGDYTKNYKADLTAARTEYDRACRIPRKRSIYLEQVTLKTGRVFVISKRL